ncbi:uncharacterized protein PITG_10128 [Phytophthora infestans T30-4]|uniref:Uncharacterized protein n=1 Tax=Phytophthora infestans (strain T30-4) TaxID=403677 RepID=D0NED6_PHYIT|nr:uncharacterized protein PITG_10128 [Phytophthora infestans T30-4]EEY56581.1 conserved hypothetical protein [Phytophthora infestans T30-4]|eukprot:XP_002902655.1 conserved hypothetical protein [Phytophthora infestans T30-4]
MASLQERLRLMTEDPRRRQVPKTQVHAALIYQREFVHRSEDFNTSAISDCAESLEVLKNGKREALETRQMMWEDHYATQTHAEQSRNEASRQQKLRQETAMLTQLKSDTDKWNMAIQLSLLEYLDVTLSAASDDVKSIYFVSTNKAGLPPLHRACKTNDVALVKLLLKVGADLTTKDNFEKEATFSSIDEENGQSCLHTAIIKNFRKVTMALIRSGRAQVNAATRDGGWTPLHLAVITEEVDVMTELLTAGAMLDAVDADGQTPLLQACLGGKLKIVRLLLNAGANPAHQNKQAHSPLHYLSAFCRDRQLLRDIIANGADVNAKSMKLNTPMHFAAMNGNEVATQVLLEYGASASVINEDKRSVVYLAKKWRHRSVEDLVRPPEEEDGHGDVHSSSGHRNKPRSPASRQAQLRSMQQHARSAGRSRPRTGVVITTRSEESDSESLYDFEDDELILPPSTPWPGAMENSSKSSNNNEKGNKSMPTTGSCQSFSELRNRFTGERSPLKPVVLAQDRQQVLMDEIVATRAKREAHQFPVVRTNTTRFSRHLVVQPLMRSLTNAS